MTQRSTQTEPSMALEAPVQHILYSHRTQVVLVRNPSPPSAVFVLIQRPAAPSFTLADITSPLVVLMQDKRALLCPQLMDMQKNWAMYSYRTRPCFFFRATGPTE